VNYLAHFHLAWPEELLVLGGLEGDFHKGLLKGELQAEFERGIALHRAIDAYTDQHPLVSQLRKNFPEHLRRYAGILIDLSFDHFLTTHWARFSTQPLAEFNGSVYKILAQHRQLLSLPAQRMASRLEEFDILGRYHHWDAVPGSAARIGERFRRGNPLRDTDQPLRPMLPEMEKTFLNFYPELIEFSKLARNNGS
jgi:acyl carrier protein phosphodiesterase